MKQEMIKCPECGAEFELSQALSRDLEVSISKKYEIQIRALKDQSQKEIEAKEKELTEKYTENQKKLKEKALKEAEDAHRVEMSDLKNQLGEKSKRLEEAQKKELEVMTRQRELEEKEKALDFDIAKRLEIKEKEIRSKLQKDQKSFEEKIKKEAENSFSLELKDLKEQLNEKNKKIEENQTQELELRKRQRQLEDKEKALELELSRKLDEEKIKILERSQKELEEKHRLRDAEKDKQLADMLKQIDDLKRKAEQGSQQAQGEVLDLELEELLKSEFPFDEIEPISKGIKGGDIIQIVKTQSGKSCGKILWETKRTKAWSDLWLQKIKDDRRDAKADIAVLVSETLPKGMSQFRIIDGVWVASLFSSLSLGLALRVVLIQVANEKILQSGKKEKMELVYNYLTGSEFKNRVEAIIESFISMKSDLEFERRATQKIWAKREQQIGKVIMHLSGMHGDLEGISGMPLPVIKSLELTTVSIEDKSGEIDDEPVVL